MSCLVPEHISAFFMQVEKLVKDIHGPALALVLERLKPYGAFQGTIVDDLASLYSSRFFMLICIVVF